MATHARGHVDKNTRRAAKLVEQGASLRKAASVAGVSRERLSRVLKEQGVIRTTAGKRVELVRTRQEQRWHLEHERKLVAMRELEKGKSVRQAAKIARVSREGLMRDLREMELIKSVPAGKQVVLERRLTRNMVTFSRGNRLALKLSPEAASRNAYYLNAVHMAVTYNNQRDLLAMAGEGVTDLYGDFHPWETDVEKLKGLTDKGSTPIVYSLA